MGGSIYIPRITQDLPITARRHYFEDNGGGQKIKQVVRSISAMQQNPFFFLPPAPESDSDFRLERAIVHKT